MVNVDIDPLIYNDLKKFVKDNKLNYPSVKFLVHKIIIDNLEEVKNNKRTK